MCGALRSIVALLAIVVVAGTGAAIIGLATHPPNTGDSYFEQAENAYNAGQYADAFQAYQRLVAQFPRNQHYERALFRSAFLSEQFLHQPERAVQLYQQLVNERPKASYADEALRNAGDILREQGKYDEAIVLYRRMFEEYGTDPNVGAQALMRIAETQHEAGDADAAVATCEEIRAKYSDLPERVAQATWELAKIRESQGDLRGALPYYEELVKRFPNSLREHEARKEIAWLKDKLGVTAVTPSEPGKHRLVKLLKSYRGQPFQEVGLYPCLRVLMADQKVVVSAEKLMGVSGEAFRFFYSPKDRLGGTDIYLDDPLGTVLEAFGFRGWKLQFANDFDSAWKVVRSLLDTDQAVLTTFEQPPPTWGIIVGYDDQTREVRLYSSVAEYRPLALESFKRIWSSPYCPTVRLHAGQRPGRYIILSVGRAGSMPAMQGIVRASVKRAHNLTRGSQVGGYFGGVRAFEELAADLDRVGKGQAGEEELRSLDAFFQGPMKQLIAARRAAGSYLAMWLSVFEGEARQALEDAAPLYDDSASALDELCQSYLAFRGPSLPDSNVRPPWEVCAEVVRIEQEAAAKLAVAAASLGG